MATSMVAVRTRGLASTATATSTARTATLLTLLVSFVAVARAQDYTSSFESNSITADGWSNGGSSWSTTSSSTPSSNTGPTGAVSGSYYAFIETSSSSSGDSFYLTQTFSSDVSVLSFYYSMYGATIGTLRVDVSSDAFSSYTTVWSKSGNQGTSAWSQKSLTLSGYDSIRFYATAGSSYTGDIALDLIEVTTGTSAPTVLPTPASPAPTITPLPSAAPSMYPTPLPTELPTLSDVPSAPPTISTGPSHVPSVLPSESPSYSPTPLPTNEPSPLPTPLPSVVMDYAAKAPGNEATQRDFNVGKVVPQRIPDQMKQAAFDILTEL